MSQCCELIIHDTVTWKYLVGPTVCWMKLPVLCWNVEKMWYEKINLCSMSFFYSNMRRDFFNWKRCTKLHHVLQSVSYLMMWVYQETVIWFNIKTLSHQCRDSHYTDKTVIQPSYLYNGNPYLYWLDSIFVLSWPPEHHQELYWYQWLSTRLQYLHC